ncbi:MAG: hypothetical protein M9887_08470 [Chitinophagales bacterium]|nr:hypothetical protein [Chitinophagales bacterium]
MAALLWIPVDVSAQTFSYNTNCQTAYLNIFKLKINEGNQLLLKEKLSHPTNLIPYFLENYADFLTLYVSDDSQLYKKLLPKKDERLSILEKGDTKSPYYLYSQASVNLQWAFIKIKYGDYFSAVFDTRRAFNLLKSNKNKFPDFLPNDKDLALLTTLFGAIPDKYKLGAKILGLKGDIDEGLSQFETILKNPNLPFKEEATIMYTMLLLHLGEDKSGAWEMIDHQKMDLKDNLLNYFVKASVAHYVNKNDEVIRLLSTRPTSTDFLAFPYLDFMLGEAKLNRLDTDADVYFKKFLSKNKGQDYIRESYRKLAWYSLISNHPNQYQVFISKVLSNGSNSLESDKAATREAESKKIPSLTLLKARLLSDGGYFSKALSVLNEKKSSDFKGHEQLEYIYRKARILDNLELSDQAVTLYKAVIETNGKSITYFAPNACVLLGQYYEKANKNKEAGFYYTKALTYKGHEYKNSIDAKAKAGLNRIKQNEY